MPGGGAVTTPWDHTKGDGLKLFVAATASLDIKFDGKPETLQHFLDAIQFRAETHGLDVVLAVETGTSTNPDIKLITTQHGSTTEAQVIAHAMVHQALDDRRRQASRTLITLISRSIEPELMDELKQRKDDCTVSVAIGTGNAAVTHKREDGALMLCHLTQLIAVDTKTTVSSILRLLTGSQMCDTMQDVGSDTKEFNKRINTHLVALRARRAEVPNIIPALFEACQSCEDSTFVSCIGRKEEQCEDNTIGSLTNTELMTSALEKHKNLNEKKLWKKKSKNELEFVALTALKAELIAAKKKLVQNPPRKQPTESKKGPTNDGIWAWKSMTPKAGEAHVKSFQGKDCICCPHHGEMKWVLKIDRKGAAHSTGCRARQEATGKAQGDAIALTAATIGESTAADTPSKKGKFMQALTNLWDEEISQITHDEAVPQE